MEQTPTNPKKSAVALLSSGLDSSVALMLALREGWTISLALTYDYGQRSAVQERKHAAKISEHFGIPHQTLSLPWFKEFRNGGSLLSNHSFLPHPNATQLSDQNFSSKSAKSVWVPNRNGVFIEIAAGFAENNKSEAVLVGFNREEAATFPDNSQSYMEAVSRSLAFSTANHVTANFAHRGLG